MKKIAKFSTNPDNFLTISSKEVTVNFIQTGQFMLIYGPFIKNHEGQHRIALRDFMVF